MCDQAEIDSYEKITIPVGTLLYSGGSETTNHCPKTHEYKGQSKHVGKILYLASDEAAAEGYAMCFTGKSGWVKKYETHTALELINITDGFTHYDWEDVIECFCKKGGNGYYLDWGDGHIEYALCNAAAFITYVGAKQCLSQGKFSEYKCRTSSKARSKSKRSARPSSARSASRRTPSARLSSLRSSRLRSARSSRLF